MKSSRYFISFSLIFIHYSLGKSKWNILKACYCISSLLKFVKKKEGTWLMHDLSAIQKVESANPSTFVCFFKRKHFLLWLLPSLITIQNCPSCVPLSRSSCRPLLVSTLLGLLSHSPVQEVSILTLYYTATPWWSRRGNSWETDRHGRLIRRGNMRCWLM